MDDVNDYMMVKRRIDKIREGAGLSVTPSKYSKFVVTRKKTYTLEDVLRDYEPPVKDQKVTDTERRLDKAFAYMKERRYQATLREVCSISELSETCVSHHFNLAGISFRNNYSNGTKKEDELDG